MVFKLLMCAEKHCRLLQGYQLLDKVIQKVIFTDGIEQGMESKKHAA
jgi:hypothetical protein